jgi:phosphotransferase system  glucose/maltose/N-acetylglucosamine-specific IIC component
LFLLIASIVKLIVSLDAYDIANIPQMNNYHLLMMIFASAHSIFCVVVCIASYKHSHFLNWMLILII